MKFGLIGDGKISHRHKHAVKENGGVIYKIHDPKYGDECIPLDEEFFAGLDYVIICSPSYLHREHINLSLKYGKKIICEKPMCLPWEPVVSDDRVNVVLQLRWMDLPDKANLIKVTMARNDEYFKMWEGDPRNTGGLLYHLFIHYIDLALLLDAKFEGRVISKGEQVRMVDDIDIMKLDMNDLYFKMYNDIINYDKGVKPKDLFYLHWWLDRNSDIYGYGTDLLNKKIIIEHKREIL
jgi:predicted dehydrogenase